MVASISVSVDTVNARTGITLSGFTAPDGAVTIYRIQPDGNGYAVRESPYLSAGGAFTYDYELPFKQSLTYQVTTTADGTVTSSAFTLSLDTFWLRAPGLPDYDMQVTVEAKPVVSRAKPQAVLRPIGATNPVVLSSARQAASFDLSIRTRNDSETTGLDSLLQQASVALLVMPGTRLPWQYVAIGDVEEAPVAPWRSLVDGDAGSQSVWKVPCQIVDRPVGGMYGDSSYSYNTLLTDYATYNAVKAAQPTYLALLQHV